MKLFYILIVFCCFGCVDLDQEKNTIKKNENTQYKKDNFIETVVPVL